MASVYCKALKNLILSFRDNNWQHLFYVSDFFYAHTHIYAYPLWLSSKRTSMRPRFDPWVQKIPWRRRWQPTLVFLPGKAHGQRSLVGFSPLGCKSWTQLSMHAEYTIIILFSLDHLFISKLSSSWICSCYVQSLSCIQLLATLWLKHIRLLCPWLSPGVCSYSRPLPQWCYLTISSATSFSFCLRSFSSNQ